MAQIYNYPNRNIRITRTNLTQKCGMCNSAPILQDAFFGPSAGIFSKTISTVVSTVQTIRRSVLKGILKTIQSASVIVKSVVKNISKFVNNSSSKTTTVNSIKNKSINASGTIQKIKFAIKTILKTIQSQASRRASIFKATNKTVIATGSISKLQSLFRYYSTVVIESGIVRKSVSKTSSTIVSIQKTIEKITTILPQIYYKTISAIVNAGNYSFYRAVSIVKSVQLNANNFFGRIVSVEKITTVITTSGKQSFVSIVKTTMASTIGFFQKQIEKITTAFVGGQFSIEKDVPIDRVILTISASFRNAISYIKSKFTKKSVIMIETEAEPQISQITSYVKEKYTKTTIE